MPVRHLIIGGGTAGMNAMRTIREEEREASEITLVTAERPYSRMVLPYYLDKSIAENHVYTATGADLGQQVDDLDRRDRRPYRLAKRVAPDIADGPEAERKLVLRFGCVVHDKLLLE